MVVELIAKDKNEKFQFVGNCKLLIDSLSKLLLVEPKNEEYKMISAMFKWKFTAQKNIMFIFAEYNFQDFALIFKNEIKCNKIYKFLLKKEAIRGNDELIFQRFLPQLFTEISKNSESMLKIKEIFANFIKKLNDDEKIIKEKYIQILKDSNAYELFYCQNEEENNQKIFRKRNASKIGEMKLEIDGNVESGFIKEKIYSNTESSSGTNECNNWIKKLPSKNCIKAPLFKVFNYFINNNILKKRLFIFLSPEQKLYYEYCWIKDVNLYRCLGCRMKSGKAISAKVITKRNGKNSVVKLDGKKKHVCEPNEYSHRIIEKPNFEIFFYEHAKKSVKRLIIFTDSTRSDCYEYGFDGSCFRCCGCSYKKFTNSAKICRKEENGEEFVLLQHSQQHICNTRKFDSMKFIKKEIIHSDNFIIYKNFEDDGVDRSKLIIFASPDKRLCYEYFSQKRCLKLYCNGCYNKRKYVTAEIYEENNGKKYVKLSQLKHVCEPREFNPEKFEMSEKIVTSSNFEIFNYQHLNISTTKLIVFFEDNNRSQCYEYFTRGKPNNFYCSHCAYTSQNVTATVYQNSDGTKYLKFSKSPHTCEPLIFNPEKYKDDIVIEKGMYEISSKTFQNGIKQKCLTLFKDDDKKLCYKYNYVNKGNYYQCSKCFHSKNYGITVFLQNEGKEDECAYASNQKHGCEPSKYLPSPGADSYVKAPMFQFIKRRSNNKNIQHMIVFTNAEKTECYDYTWQQKENRYICHICVNKLKVYVFAKILKDDEGNDFVELSQTQHKCTPIKFIPEDLDAHIVRSPNFKIWEDTAAKKGPRKMLTIYKSTNPNLGYSYLYQEKSNNYLCGNCRSKKKYISARVLHDENGKEYVELSKNEHVCELLNIDH